ncbi:GNAT family N-acetyltransferase [Collimonas pratensis]|uniref:GNAT family N-acetyltransferase n=1 Tax=Collimonas pratensis TaxID=279113 RepID=UPI00143D3E9D|nr:GNAT family N-acetyltransferase [Collimonas pratensis]NKI68689.1 GNAT family N-acetyltransferase [Collimonas pratensis]
MKNSQRAFNQMSTAQAWARGWTLTRCKRPPLNQSYGCKIDLGAPDHLERHVVSNFDRQAVRELSSSLTVPGTWLKVCAGPEMVKPFLGDIWTVQAPEYLMAAALRKNVIIARDDYQLSIRTSDAVTDAELRSNDGQLAARGRVAQSNGFAVFDQIVTEPEHQRKGLGRIVMGALSNVSIASESKIGVLVATEDGCALYKALGWTIVSPVTAAVIG